MVNETIIEYNVKGKSSRMRRTIIENAIENLSITAPTEKYNKFRILDEICDIMSTKYKTDKQLDYHSERMGMKRTNDILMQIEIYFFRDFKFKN